MAFSLRRAMVGLGEAASDVGKDWFGTEVRKRAAIDLENVRASIQADRDARLHEQNVSMERDVRQPFVSGESEKQRGFQSGESEKGRTFQAGESEKGRTFQGEQNEAERGIRKQQVEEQSRHNRAVENISAAAEGRLAKGAGLDNAIKQIAIDNAKTVEKLKTEFSTATQERKRAISEEIQILTGKDNDSYLPVPLKDELGNITGYKIFDKKRGTWVDGGGGNAPYPDGTELKGKDGKVYVVQGGRPVPKGGAQPKATPSLDPLEEGDRNDVGFDKPPQSAPEPKSRGLIERERVLRKKAERDKESYAKKYLGNI